MKSDFNTYRNSTFWRRAILVSASAFTLLGAHTFADVVNVSYTTGNEVPLRSDNFDPTGKSLSIALTFVPPKDRDLVVVRNSGPGFIRGHFANLAQGQIVTLYHGGQAYHFVANYYGGQGKDLVLMPTSLDDLSAAARQKLDDQLVLALKRNRGEAPFDRATSLRPEDYERADRVLVDVQGSINANLATEIRRTGAEIVADRQTATSARVWVPISQLQAVANIPGVTAMSAARPSVTHHFVPEQKTGMSYNVLSQ